MTLSEDQIESIFDDARGMLITCYHCGETTNIEEGDCRYCGEDPREPEEDEEPEPTRPFGWFFDFFKATENLKKRH